MQEVFKMILERLETLKNRNPFITTKNDKSLEASVSRQTLDYAKQIVKEVAEEYNNGWIPCSEKMPPVETEVFIVTKRKYSGGKVRYITTTAMYEDGTVLEKDSCWRWEEIEGEWDEENDCYIIPEGWWEYRHYNPEEVYCNAVDDEVIAWQPLQDPCREDKA